MRSDRPAPYLSRRTLLAIGGAAGLAACTPDNGESPEQTPAQQSIPAPTPEGEGAPPTAEEPETEQAEEADDDAPASEASWDPDSTYVLVNKRNPLEPADHVPSDLRELDIFQHYEGQQLREEAAGALEELFAAAAEEGHALAVTTAYRDYEHQFALYDSWYWEHGQEWTDARSARPGYSEHQTGLAVDILTEDSHPDELLESFGGMPEGEWVAEHAHEFGFIIRYPEGAEDITGYQYEPWHLRYLGVEAAAEVFEEGVTLEEHWDQPPAPDYEYDYLEDPAVDR
ncbi:M15 family metallopeptidase [Nesterenkonia populi]|uniref:M15 family metallopeptidase n=1 Tax=Nesterenkonia populi TaxID=1591087 RepID=UPI0011BD4C54|nr:M15 family metallopeptidase [Nesterenkonia populi]